MEAKELHVYTSTMPAVKQCGGTLLLACFYSNEFQRLQRSGKSIPSPDATVRQSNPPSLISE